MRPPLQQGHSDNFQTPPLALVPLLPFLKPDWLIWEAAEGEGNLTRGLEAEGFKVIGSDILSGQDFLRWEPSQFDCVITNPPFSLKLQFLERAYQLRKPFAFLLPLTALETEKRQKLYKEFGLQVILLNKRINFKTPCGKGSGSWFATMWLTNWLNLPQQLVFRDISSSKQLEMEGI